MCCRKWLKSICKSPWKKSLLCELYMSVPILWEGRGEGSVSLLSCKMGTTGDDMAAVEQNASLNPLCFECGQQHWTRENHLYNYQNEVDDDLVCHICLQPLLQPLDTPCGHTFCYKCLRNFLQEKDFCPLDRKRLHFKLCKKSSILVHKLLDKLTVLCPFSSVCQEVMQRCDLAGHLKNRSVLHVLALHFPWGLFVASLCSSRNCGQERGRELMVAFKFTAENPRKWSVCGCAEAMHGITLFCISHQKIVKTDWWQP